MNKTSDVERKRGGKDERERKSKREKRENEEETA